MLAMLLQEYNEFATKYLKIVKCLLGRSDIDVNAGGATEKPIHIVCRMKNIDGRDNTVKLSQAQKEGVGKVTLFYQKHLKDFV